MNLLAVLLLAGGASSFYWLVGCEQNRRKQVLDRKSFIQRRRMAKLADLSRRRRHYTRVSAGVGGADAKAAAEMLAAMMGGSVVDRPAMQTEALPQEPV